MSLQMDPTKTAGLLSELLNSGPGSCSWDDLRADCSSSWDPETFLSGGCWGGLRSIGALAPPCHFNGWKPSGGLEVAWILAARSHAAQQAEWTCTLGGLQRMHRLENDDAAVVHEPLFAFAAVAAHRPRNLHMKFAWGTSIWMGGDATAATAAK